MKLRILALVPILGALCATPAQAADVSWSVFGTAGNNGWYVSDVWVNWTITNVIPPLTQTCGATHLASDTAAGVARCTVTDGSGTTTKSTTPIKIDQTPPRATGSPARAADANGWFNHPVAVTFNGSDATSGSAGCGSASYSGPDSAAASVSTTCSDNAGNVGTVTYPLNYDATPPQITGASPDRAPDFGNWFLNPVTMAFSGTDATSGLASCDRVTYSGPDGAQAGVTGSCRDRAGNVATSAIPIAYDATAPTLTPKAAAGDTVTTLTWTTSSDTQSVVISRTPGPNKPVYQGNATKFEDRHVRNGTKYTYTLTATDEAGHATAASATARPTAQLLSPRPFAKLKTPPLLRWKRVRHAGYYNVQLYRVLRGAKGETFRRKVLSRWPLHPRLRLHSAWRYNGRWHRLAPGTYLWYVWPGYGKRTQRRYGRLRGVRTFTMV